MSVEAAVSFAVETLGNLLIQKAVFLRGVRGDVEWLRNELRRMQCFLKDAEKKQSESKRIRNWISEIREVAHDAADAIEMFVLNVESRGKQGRCCGTCLPGHAYHLNRVGKEIKSIRERLEDIERSRVNYSINQDLGHHQRLEYSSSQLQVESWRRLAYWQKDNDVVGLEQDVEELVEKLLRISTSAEKRRREKERKRLKEINEWRRQKGEEWRLEKERKDKEAAVMVDKEERKNEEAEAVMEEEEKKAEEAEEEEEGEDEDEERKRLKEILKWRRQKKEKEEWRIKKERKDKEERKHEEAEPVMEEEEKKAEEAEEEEDEDEERKRLKEILEWRRQKKEEEWRIKKERKDKEAAVMMNKEERKHKEAEAVMEEEEKKAEEAEAVEEEEEEEEEAVMEEEEERKGLSVAAIVGMGGIGKSTLASRIYHHPAVVDRFECRAWVVVSNEFMLEDIMKQIMLQLGVSLDHLKLLESMSDELRRQEILQQELHKELKGKLYFIVLDDLWEPDHWESLRRAFPDDKASRLMVTSRNKDMSKYSDDYVHEMKLLDANRSWKLLLRKAFVDNGEGKCPEDLKEVGEEILRKCSGLPLAISVVGGLLLKKTPCRSEWEKVANEMKYHFDSSGSSGGGIDTISTILELSYHNLIPELKACFLCLGFFKKDDIIKAKSLVHIWVAQDLVPQEVVAGKETMEDVARNYLNELISRNMVQVKESKYDQIKACHMHDLLRDLSLRKAKEEINFEVLREDGDQNSHQSSSREPRHRAVYSNQLKSIYSNRNQHVRSLFIYGEIEYTGDGPSSYWKCFELLRVLDLGNARFQVWPKTIGLLTGLRYFKMVYYGSISNLPRSWANLKNLEVLHLGCASELFITDQVILEMDGLRHLYAYITCSNSKVPLGNLRNLQTLSWFVLEDSNIWQVSKMTGVCKLGFDMRRMLDASRLFTYLAKLENLFSLTLTYQVSKNMDGLQTLHRITQLKLVTMSLPGSFPPNLSHLTLTRMRLAEDPLPELERLPKLLYLKLRDAYVGQKMAISCHGFPSLKVLCLQDNVGVKNIETEKGAMPELKQLMIYNCRRLIIENLPEHLKSKIIDAD